MWLAPALRLVHNIRKLMHCEVLCEWWTWCEGFGTMQHYATYVKLNRSWLYSSVTYRCVVLLVLQCNALTCVYCEPAFRQCTNSLQSEWHPFFVLDGCDGVCLWFYLLRKSDIACSNPFLLNSTVVRALVFSILNVWTIFPLAPSFVPFLPPLSLSLSLFPSLSPPSLVPSLSPPSLPPSLSSKLPSFFSRMALTAARGGLR